MAGHRVVATVEKEGRLVLDGLPFHAGDVVAVTIRLLEQSSNRQSDQTLRDTSIRYDRPCDPAVDVDDLEAS